MIQRVLFVLVAVLSIDTISQSAFAYNTNGSSDNYVSFRHSRNNRPRNNNNNQNYDDSANNNGNNGNSNTGSGTGSDSQLINAMQSNQNQNFVEGSGLVVTQLLPDDTSGLEHQKWVVRLSNGATMMAVYNLDMVVNGQKCPHVPLHVGDVISMGGQYIATGNGRGLLHWLHMDPRGTRPDGYVQLNGQFYCK